MVLMNDSYWSTLVVAGVFSLVVGAVVIAYPSPSLKTLALFTGVYLLLAGIALLVRTFSGDTEPGSPGFFIGVMALIAGIVVIKHPGGSLAAVTLVVGTLLVVTGAVDLAHGVVHAEGRALRLVRAVFLIAGGTVILSVPKMSVGTLAALVGISICLQGAVQICEGFLLRAHRPAA
jgi:uncharacterized membrane protein HdeD (DUF308 family)